MNDHPYAGADAIRPGETADDDPFDNQPYCENCDNFVELVVGTCPGCGTEIE